MSSTDCVFCKIISGEIPAEKVFENEEFISFKDINPQCRTHLLVVPKKHIESIADAFPEGEENSGEAPLMGRLIETSVRVAREQGLMPNGFRSIINTGAGGGQTVFHIHLHLMGGEPLGPKLIHRLV